MTAQQKEKLSVGLHRFNTTLNTGLLAVCAYFLMNIYSEFQTAKADIQSGKETNVRQDESISAIKIWGLRMEAVTNKQDDLIRELFKEEKQ